MAQTLRAHRVPVFPASKPSPLIPQGDSRWPIVLMAVIFVLGFLFITFMVSAIFSPTGG